MKKSTNYNNILIFILSLIYVLFYFFLLYELNTTNKFKHKPKFKYNELVMIEDDFYGHCIGTIRRYNSGYYVVFIEDCSTGRLYEEVTYSEKNIKEK